jgi:hypothetical protein
LGPSTGLDDGGSAVNAAVYVGAPENLVGGGHAYVDSLTFEIVPEPGTLVLLVLAGLALAMRRR